MGARVNKLAIAAALLIAATSAHGQIYRCKTPSGGTEYSQIPCGKDAQLVQSQKDSIDTSGGRSPLDSLREQEAGRRAYDGAYRKPLRAGSAQPAAPRQIDQAACDRADREAKIEARHARKDAAAIRRTQKLADWECGRDVADEIEAPTARKQPSFIPGAASPPPVITNCDSAGCWDSNGGRYTKAAGDTFFGPGGIACTRTAGGIICP